MNRTLIIGAGGVGAAVTHKSAQHNDVLGDICLASRTQAKCERIVAEVRAKGNLRDRDRKLHTAAIDARDVRRLVALIKDTGSNIVINVGSVHCNLAIIEACLEAGAHYIDTGIYEREGELNRPPPWYASYEWTYRDRFAERGLTGVLGCGFDPGAVNAFCAYVRKHRIDDIESIDIMDVNAGDHGRYFATNFDPVTNLREIMEDVVYWEDGEWVTIPPHSKSRVYDFPVVGEHTVYSMGHDEIHSLARNIPARRIEFWMGFGDQYLNCFDVLRNVGLLSHEPVDVDGAEVRPIDVLKEVLPDPASLAPDYSGKTCIGCLIKGRSHGKPRELFIYNICDHAACHQEVGSQAISYTTAVPAVTAALLIADGPWRVGRLVNVEELDPDPFMKRMPKLGLDWDIRERRL
ncbi:saccharopine dehydrogenase family protein [Haliangium sp.]|uniref:saccharopine dehydrogenase family protein n=1 Tax=Haliangium sp. TaxID=2663208 RepID=UPI003D0B7315